MKTSTTTVGLILLALAGCAAPDTEATDGLGARRGVHALAADDPDEGKVEIWHHGDEGIEIIHVASSAAPAHLAHGDWTNPIFVDASAGPGGNGLAQTPLGRLADALAAASAMRTATGETEWAADPITVVARPGTYRESVVIDVPGIVLQGSSTLRFDDPSGPPAEDLADPASMTLLAPAVGPLKGSEALIAIRSGVGPDGSPRAGNGTVVSGWVLESGNTAPGVRAGVGVYASGVEDVVVESSILRAQFGVAIDAYGSTATVDRVHAKDAGACAVCLTGGDYTIRRSALRDGFSGVGLIPAPASDPSVASATVLVEDSDLRGNKRMPISSGVRVFAVGPAATLQASSADLVVRRTQFGDSRNGVLVDAGFPEWAAPGVPRPVDTEVDVALEDNTWGTFVHAPLVVTFTRGQAALGPLARGAKPYVSDAWWSIDLEGTDEGLATSAWIDHPVQDPYDPTPVDLLNTLTIDGTPVDPGECSGFSFCPVVVP